MRWHPTGSQIEGLRSLPPQQQAEQALRYVQGQTTDLELLRAAIQILGTQPTDEAHEALIAKYRWCAERPLRRDGGAFVRTAIISALQSYRQVEDESLYLEAVLTYEFDGPTETGGELRAAALTALDDINPKLAEFHAARFLHDPQFTFSGEPLMTAISVLRAHHNLAPIFGLAAWTSARSDVLGEALRNLADLPALLVPILIQQHHESEDPQIVLGLFDLLLAHPGRNLWIADIEHWFRATTFMDLYGIIAIQIVGSRSELLIDMLRDIRNIEVDPLRQQLLDQALA